MTPITITINTARGCLRLHTPAGTLDVTGPEAVTFANTLLDMVDKLPAPRNENPLLLDCCHRLWRDMTETFDETAWKLWRSLSVPEQTAFGTYKDFERLMVETLLQKRRTQ